MLYVSRYFGLRNYGVVDTDDGVEEIVSASGIVEAAIAGLEVAGFELQTATITPYQVPHLRNKVQIKLELLHKISVVTYNGDITAIKFDAECIGSPVKIRLSDIDVNIGDYILRRNDVCKEHKITLVFDDKLKYMSAESFPQMTAPGVDLGVSGLGVVFDLTEVTNDELAAQFYRSLSIHDSSFSSLNPGIVFKSVVDIPERKYDMVRFYVGREAVECFT